MNPNPFDQDGVIRILLEEADIPTLKTLRELNTNWSSLDLKELENRATKGEFRDYNFSWGYRDNQKSLEEAKEELAQFLEATHAISQLFRDFRFNFPESLKFFNAPFFTKYHPIFIYLDIHSFIIFNDDISKLLMNFLTWVAPTLKELCIGDVYRSTLNGDVLPTSWWMPEDFLEFSENPQSRLNFPKLNKFSMNRYTKELPPFLVIFDKGGEVNTSPNLKELAIGHLNVDFGDLLGLGTRSKVGYQRWSTLTHLTLYTDHYCNLGVAETIRHLCILSKYGMTLNYLDLHLSRERIHISHFSETSVILGQFLESQSSSLEYFGLFLSFKINTQNILEQEFEEYQTSIRLPIFPNVLKLKIAMLSIRVDDIRVIPLQMGPFPTHFPKLRSLEIHFPKLLRGLFERVNVEHWPVREIIFYDLPDYLNESLSFDENFDWLRANFRSVISFDAPFTLHNRLEILPWADSLEHLHIQAVRAPLKLSHLTRLNHLVVSGCIPNSANMYRNCVYGYLEHFKEILELNLNKITFQIHQEICDEVKGHIKSYFPFEIEFESSGTKRFF